MWAGHINHPPPSAHTKQLRSKRRRICMISFSAYESDNRVMRYAEALASRGDAVDVLAVKKNSDQGDTERIHGVLVHRLQERTKKNQQRKNAYLLPLLKFWWRCSVWLMRRQLREHYDLIHVHNVPDFLVFISWFSKLLGTKIVLDIHDLLPEFFASKFRGNARPFEIILLKQAERLCAKFADHVIISNHLWHETFISRSASPDKCSVFLNYVDQNIFQPRIRTRNDGKFIVLFPGGLQWHQGLDIAIRAFERVAEVISQSEFHIYGDGNMRDELTLLARRLGLDGKVQFHNPLPLRAISDVMADADLGVVPKRANSFGNEAYSTKILEFMSLGVPVIVSDTKIDRHYFDDSVVRFFESGNVDALARAIIELLNDENLRRQMAARAMDYAAQNSWETHRGKYFELVDSLIENRRLASSAAKHRPIAVSSPEKVELTAR